MKVPLPVAVAVTTLAVIIGHFVGHEIWEKPITSDPKSGSPAPVEATRAPDPSAAQDFELAAKKIIEEAQSPLEKNARLYRLIEKLNVADIPGALNSAIH